MCVDLLMVLALLTLMAYSLIGETTHEIIGITMFVLFTAHHLMNIGWYKGLGKGQYQAARILMTATNFLMLLGMLLQVTAGVLLSKHVFTFIPSSAGSSVFRLIHLAVPYWLFCLASLHLGFHWKVMMAAFSKKAGERKTVWHWIERAAALGISVYGIYTFVKRQFPDYMFLKTQFAFFDFGEPLKWFFLDYIAVMVLFASIGYCMIKGCHYMNRKNKPQKENQS